MKYKSVTLYTTIDGVQAMPEQIKVVPPKEKKRGAPSTVLENEEKRPQMTMTLM